MMSKGSFRLKMSFNFCEIDEKRDQDSLRRISFFYIFRKIFENLESSWFAWKCNKLYIFPQVSNDIEAERFWPAHLVVFRDSLPIIH